MQGWRCRDQQPQKEVERTAQTDIKWKGFEASFVRLKLPKEMGYSIMMLNH